MSGDTTSISITSPDQGEELQRAELYGLLSRLWLAPPDAELLAQFAVAVTQAPQPGSFLEGPWQALVAAMRSTTVDAARDEFQDLFVATGKAEILPYASHHLAGVLNERPLVALRQDLAAIGLEQDPARGDTEDHVAFVFEVMRYLIAGDDAAVCNLEQQRRLFRVHVQSWVGELADAVDRHPRAHLYRSVAVMTRAFVDVETQAFDMLEA